MQKTLDKQEMLIYAKNKEINPVNPNQLVGRGRRKNYE